MWRGCQEEEADLHAGVQTRGSGYSKAKSLHRRILLHKPKGTPSQTENYHQVLPDQLQVECLGLAKMFCGLLGGVPNQGCAL